MEYKKMNYQQFLDKVRSYFEEKYGAMRKVQIRQVWKNNGILLQGLTMPVISEYITPTLYLESFYEKYEQGEEIAQVLRMIEYTYFRHQIEEEKPLLTYFGDYEKVRTTLCVKLINYEANREFLKEVVYKKVLDLALVCYSLVESDSLENGSITIRREHLKKWGVNERQVIRDAIENAVELSPYMFGDFTTVLKGMLPDESSFEDAGKSLYVLSSERMINGAAVICYPGVLKKCAKQIGEAVFLIPSSVHEVILLPADGYVPEELRDTIREVNTFHVAAEEVLSDHLYTYDEERDCLLDLVTHEVYPLEEDGSNI